ncbi:hypothetical protein EVJ58_g8390 [Rhodofomes roseus]|uniref:Uncharacterized protein n=1 Tax=Rhodofomes roseus TaxID=34475 RepID=A0A4Y9Y320_9APHY|nr:hypothetical protein EVJ58_g8390 [Rhodofomes roseus]
MDADADGEADGDGEEVKGDAVDNSSASKAPQGEIVTEDGVAMLNPGETCVSHCIYDHDNDLPTVCGSGAVDAGVLGLAAAMIT